MSDFLLAQNDLIRFAAFLAVFGLLAVIEAFAPRRVLPRGRLKRWISNLGLPAISAISAKLILPLVPLAAAAWAQSAGVGLFNWAQTPLWLTFPIAILLLDLAIFGQHVVTHKVPLLWRLHRMHHSDVVLDVSTALRFHPIEILLSLLWKIAVIAALGAPILAVLAFEILLNASALFTHSGLRLGRFDRLVRMLLVTPDMHRVHHSIHRSETDSNFGFALSFWDRLFGTYRAQPRDGHDAMLLGLSLFRNPQDNRLDRLLLQPFRADAPAARPDGSRSPVGSTGSAHPAPVAPAAAQSPVQGVKADRERIAAFQRIGAD